jgi:hypothetical protein
VTVLGQYEFNVSTFQQAMLSLLNGNVGDVSSKMMFLGLARHDESYTNGLMKFEAWILATIIVKIMLGTLYVSYFFSVVLYPYARFKVRLCLVSIRECGNQGHKQQPVSLQAAVTAACQICNDTFTGTLQHELAPLGLLSVKGG